MICHNRSKYTLWILLVCRLTFIGLRYFSWRCAMIINYTLIDWLSVTINKLLWSPCSSFTIQNIYVLILQRIKYSSVSKSVFSHQYRWMFSLITNLALTMLFPTDLDCINKTVCSNLYLLVLCSYMQNIFTTQVRWSLLATDNFMSTLSYLPPSTTTTCIAIYWSIIQ